MIRKRIHLLLGLLSVLYLSCNNEEKNLYIEDITYCSYSLGTAEKQQVLNGDTIACLLGETLFIYVDSMEEPMVYTQSPVELEKNDNGEYVYSPTEPLLTPIAMKFLEGEAPVYFYFYIKVEVWDVTYLIVENSCLIDVEKDSLKI
ncbi:MAG: hypothetical protein LIP05_15980 [Tannerellaceae bacterium]|nr:hypothetical protein [Tannerellaceae bacterium]